MNPFKPNTHNHFIFKTLLTGTWWNVIDIMFVYGQGVRNMAIRSRVSDMNGYAIKHNLEWQIESRIGDNKQGEYRLVSKTAENAINTACKAPEPVQVPETQESGPDSPSQGTISQENGTVKPVKPVLGIVMKPGKPKFTKTPVKYRQNAEQIKLL